MNIWLLQTFTGWNSNSVEIWTFWWRLGRWEAPVEVEHKGPGQLTLVHTVTSKLPLLATSNQHDDDDDEIPLLSYDARRGSWNLGARWSDGGQFGTRAYFQVIIIITIFQQFFLRSGRY